MDWKKIYRVQEKSGWCGPAVIQMALFAGGIEKTQAEIARETYHSWWGTTQQTLLAYLSQFFGSVGFKEGANISDLSEHLKKGHIVIVNWWDDVDPEDAEGHYSLITDTDIESKKITLADPSSGRGIWKIDQEKFEKNWYDFLDINNKIKLTGWLLWVDPNSKSSKSPQLQ